MNLMVPADWPCLYCVHMNTTVSIRQEFFWSTQWKVHYWMQVIIRKPVLPPPPRAFHSACMLFSCRYSSQLGFSISRDKNKAASQKCLYTRRADTHRDLRHTQSQKQYASGGRGAMFLGLSTYSPLSICISLVLLTILDKSKLISNQ